MLNYAISSCNSIKTLDFSTRYNSLLKSEGQLKRIRSTTFYEKERPTQKQIPCFRKGQILLISTKTISQKLIPTKCSSFWLAAYL